MGKLRGKRKRLKGYKMCVSRGQFGNRHRMAEGSFAMAMKAVPTAWSGVDYFIKVF